MVVNKDKTMKNVDNSKILVTDHMGMILKNDLINFTTSIKGLVVVFKVIFPGMNNKRQP